MSSGIWAKLRYQHANVIVAVMNGFRVRAITIQKFAQNARVRIGTRREEELKIKTDQSLRERKNDFWKGI
jgi:hypothetical protein